MSFIEPMWVKWANIQFCGTPKYYDPKMNPVQILCPAQPWSPIRFLNEHNNTVILRPPLSEFVLNAHLPKKKKNSN